MYLYTLQKLSSVDILLANTTGNVYEAKKYLEERYIYWGVLSYGVFAYTDGKGKMMALNVDDTLGLNILYFTLSDFKGNDIYSQYLNAKQRFK